MYTLFENITHTSIQLLLKEPFYGHYFSTIVKEVSDEVPTMGVAVGEQESVKLFVNEHFWNEILVTDAYKYGVLKHEILHVVLKHILMVDQFIYRDIANIAMDMVVNQYIKREQLPGKPVLIENYPTLDLKHNQDVDYYYKKLLHLYQNSPQNEAALQLQNDLDKCKSHTVTAIGSHQKWSALPNAKKKMLSTRIDQTIREVVQRTKKNASYGSLPTSLKAYFETIEKKAEPFINWRRVLRIFTNSSSRTYIKNTIRRPSRRYGTVPGVTIKRRNKVLVAIDTSGSVSDKDLSVFFGELHHIYRKGAEITIIECDTRIQNQYFYNGVTPDFVMGRGGTDFNAPIRFANETYLPDALIYFTDGYASPPQISARMPILWLITANGIDEQVWEKFQGRKVKMIPKIY